MNTWFGALNYDPPETKPKIGRAPRPWMADIKKLAVGESTLVPYTTGSVTANANRATGWKFKQQKEGDQLRLTRIA